MQSRLLTIPRADPRFMPHLLGSFSNEERALPVDLLFHDTKEERITFRIVQINEIDCPGKVMTLLTGVRPLLLLLTMGPAATSIFYAMTFGWEIDIGIAACTLMSIFFLHGAAFLMNDYCDHLSGMDRLSCLGGSRIVQRGWATAEQVKNWSWMCWVSGLMFGLPSLWLRPWPMMLLIGGTAALIVVGFSYMRRSERYLGLDNLMVFFGMGPLLTAGTSFAVTGRIGSEVLIFGAIFGLGASLCIQLRNFETMLADSQMRTRTLMSRLGLEKSKLFVMVQLFFILCLMSLFVYVETVFAIYWLVMTPVFGVAVHLGLRIWSVGSPLSSQLRGLWRQGLVLHLCLLAASNLLFYFLYLSRT